MITPSSTSLRPVFLVCALLSCWQLSESVAGDNILLLIADDYGVDSNGLYAGAGSAPTPVLDSLAVNGVRFTNFWANPICSPTRAAILTGRHGFRTGVGSPTGNNAIGLNEYSIAAALGEAGYHTACIGKWHLQGPNNGQALNPNLMGFDDYMGSLGGGLGNYFDWTKVVNGASENVTDYATSETVDDTIAWIGSKGSDPWFCWVAFNAPHTPFHLPPTDLHSYDTLSGTAADISANPLPYYQAMVESMDTEIGRLLGAIDSAVLANTTIIFIGDNGTPGQVATDFERGQKGQLFQGGVHVPCIISGASVSAPLGRTHDAFAHVVDLFDTIAELAGVDTSNDLPGGTYVDSISFAPYLVDPNLPSFHDVVFAERFTIDGANQDGKTVRNGRFKLIRLDNGNERFYDLQNDPLETTNLPVGNQGGQRAQNYEALTAFLDNLLASPAAPTIESVVVNGGDVQRSVVTELSLNFSSSVGIDDSNGSPFVILNRDSNETVDHTATVNRVDGNTNVLLNFVAGPSVNERGSLLPSLADGDFQITVDASLVNLDNKLLDGNGDGTGGDNYVFGTLSADRFYCLFGDHNGNGLVDLFDFSAFRAAYATSSSHPNYVQHFDVDGNGLINLFDFSRFRNNYGN